MEHRWGRRLAIDLKVRLDCRPNAIGTGRMVDASLSGCFVTTDLHLPPLTRVRVQFQGPFWRGDRRAVEGYVVRPTPEGLGIEWHEFAPPEIAALLEAPEAQLAGERRRFFGMPW